MRMARMLRVTTCGANTPPTWMSGIHCDTDPPVCEGPGMVYKKRAKVTADFSQKTKCGFVEEAILITTVCSASRGEITSRRAIASKMRIFQATV